MSVTFNDPFYANIEVKPIYKHDSIILHNYLEHVKNDIMILKIDVMQIIIFAMK